jgi:hypothetical protein
VIVPALTRGFRVRLYIATALTATLAILAGGCGTFASSAAPAPVSGSESTALPTTAEPATTSSMASTTSSIASTAAPSLDAVFEAIALAMAPVHVYGWDDLPAEATVDPDWWPVIQVDDPAAYDGERLANPRIVGQGSDEPQAELVLRLGEGWLLLFENFRGDLGDVQGRSVGAVGGREAMLYDVNGGQVVQWSDAGRWYSVFGRGVATNRLVEIALALRLVAAKQREGAD